MCREMTGICRDFQYYYRLLTPCHTRLRRPPRGPFSYQGGSTRGVRHSPAVFPISGFRPIFQSMPGSLTRNSRAIVGISRGCYRIRKPLKPGNTNKKYEQKYKSPIPGWAPKIRKEYRKITKTVRKWPFL